MSTERLRRMIAAPGGGQRWTEGTATLTMHSPVPVQADKVSQHVYSGARHLIVEQIGDERR